MLSSSESKSEDRRKEILMLKDKVNNLEIALDVIENPNYKTPDWLDTTKEAYSPKVRIVRTDGTTMEVAVDQREFYAETPSLRKIIDLRNFKNKTHDDKLRSIHSYVVNRLNYQFDKGEDWRFPNITNLIRVGDCEDGTTLFVTLARLAGIPPTDVFNATGLYYVGGGDGIGHSWPIAKLSDGKWYVFETTLPYYQPEEEFRNSDYYCSWGISNWIWSGKIKNNDNQL